MSHKYCNICKDEIENHDSSKLQDCYYISKISSEDNE